MLNLRGCESQPLTAEEECVVFVSLNCKIVLNELSQSDALEPSLGTTSKRFIVWSTHFITSTRGVKTDNKKHNN